MKRSHEYTQKHRGHTDPDKRRACGLFHFRDMKNDIMIWAVRDGRRKPFPSSLWARMPAHRWGWVEEQPQRPAVLDSLPPKAEEKAEKAKRPAKKQRKIEK